MFFEMQLLLAIIATVLYGGCAAIAIDYARTPRPIDVRRAALRRLPTAGHDAYAGDDL